MLYMKGFQSVTEALFPNIVNICVLRGACPCHCAHCPVGKTKVSQRGTLFGKETMDLGLFRKIIDEMSSYPHSAARIHSVGEPLLWHSLLPALEYARSKSVNTWVFTSLITTEKKTLVGLAMNSRIIEVSLNSIDSQDYIETKGVDAFDLVRANLEFLSSHIKKNDLGVRLLVSRVASRYPEKDRQFVDRWSLTGVPAESFIRSYHDYNGVLGESYERTSTHFPCLVHWARFSIDCNGDAAVCFNELFKGKRVDESLVLGNLKGSSIASIWQGEKLNKIREAQLTGDASLVDFTDKLPCFGCRFCQPLDGKEVTSEHQLAMICRQYDNQEGPANRQSTGWDDTV
jgi:hypothetical protein